MTQSFKRLQEQAYDYLKEMILTGQFNGNEMYSEAKTAAKLGISRTPVRDALLRLTQEGYIDIFPSRGYKVRVASHEDIEEIAQIRCALEGYCAYSLAKNIETPEAVETLNALKEKLKDQKRLKEEDADQETFAESDSQFHNIIIDYMQNPQFSSTFHNYEHKMKDLKRHLLLYPGRVNAVIKEHAYIISLIENGETIGAFEFIHDHADVTTYIAHRDVDDGSFLGAPKQPFPSYLFTT